MKYTILFMVEEANNEFEQIFNLVTELFVENQFNYHIIIVANGTEKFVKEHIETRRIPTRALKIISFHQKVASAVCLNAALHECQGDVLMILGPFQELHAGDYTNLIKAFQPGIDIVVPYRKKRKDPIVNKLHSKFLNFVLKIVVGEQIRDIGCRTKLIHRQVFDDIELHGNMFKYLPALARRKGFKILELECEQQLKERKTRFYSGKIYLDRLVEIIYLFFSSNFSKKPLRFFSLIGSGFISIGIISLIIATLQRAFFGVLIGNRPILMMSIIAIVFGAQFASFGLLGEIISFVHGRSHKEYNIEKII